MTILKWITCIPLGLFGAALILGLLIWAGDFAFGGWRFSSGLLIYSTAGCYPALAVSGALYYAPRKTAIIKWILLSIVGIYACVVLLPGLYMLLFQSAQLESIPNLEISRSLSPYWQMLLLDTGFLAGILWAASRSVDELGD